MSAHASPSSVRRLGLCVGVSVYVYRANPNYLRHPNVCVGCFELIICKFFVMAPKKGEIILFLRFFRNSVLRGHFWHTESKIFFIFAVFLASGAP